MPWGKALSRALLGTTNLSVGGAGVLAAAALHSGAVLALGAAAFSALVAWDLATPAHWKSLTRAQRRAPELPNPLDLHDPTAAKFARALQEARAELDVVVQKSEGQVGNYLGIALGSLTELEASAARLLRRLEELSLYLAGEDPRLVQVEMADLTARMKETEDPEARAEFDKARDARTQQLQTLKDLRDVRDRVSANLSRLVATFEGLPGRVVHLRALDDQAMDSMSGNVGQDLERMNHEITAFEETLKPMDDQVHA